MEAEQTVQFNGTTYIFSIDLAKPEVSICSCVNPNGFKFIEYGPGYQVWEHVKCGGQVKKPLIRSKTYLK